MNIPEGAKFLFFVVPVFVVSIGLILFFFSKNDLAVDTPEKTENVEDIFGSESDVEQVEDFEEFNIETTQEGQGRGAAVGDDVSVHYTGTLRDGTEFDSSYNSGEPFTFVLGIGQVIQGWDEGIVGMKVGEKRRLEIPSSLGYGPEGSRTIPGGAGLIFETELISIN